MKKRYFSLVAIMMVCISAFCLLSGCGISTKTFYYSEGFAITLSEEFSETEVQGIDYCLSSKNVAVYVQEVTFEELKAQSYAPETMSAKHYAEILVSTAGVVATVDMNEEDGYAHFTYKNTVSSTTYSYYSVVKKGSDAFWVCEFACYEAQAQNLAKSFERYADSIVVI